MQLAIHRWVRPAVGLVHYRSMATVPDQVWIADISLGRRSQQGAGPRSMGSAGDSLDWAAAEQFFATVQRELSDSICLHSRGGAGMSAFGFMEGFDICRRHSSRGNVPRSAFEQGYASCRGENTPCPSTMAG